MALSAIAFGWVISGSSILNAWDWTGVVGTLIVLVAYILATIGAARMLRQYHHRAQAGRSSSRS